MRESYKFCPRCGKTPSDLPKKGNSEGIVSFQSFSEKKNEERKTFFKHKPGLKKMAGRPVEEIVTINIGIASVSDGVTKAIRGKSLPLRIKKAATRDEVLEAALKKRATHDRSFR